MGKQKGYVWSHVTIPFFASSHVAHTQYLDAYSISIDDASHFQFH